MKKSSSKVPAAQPRGRRSATPAPTRASRTAKPSRKAPAAAPAPARTRKATNLTLSEQAKAMGRILAEARGMNFSQLVEQLVRDEMRRKPQDL